MIPQPRGGTHWAAAAACAPHDPDVFFPDREQSPQAVYARAVCRRCTVWRECLDEALRLGDEQGIRGGLSARERRRILKTARPERAPA